MSSWQHREVSGTGTGLIPGDTRPLGTTGSLGVGRRIARTPGVALAAVLMLGSIGFAILAG